MKKRFSIMVSGEIYKELKKLKARLLVEKEVELKSLGEVIHFMIKNFDHSRGGTSGDKEVF